MLNYAAKVYQEYHNKTPPDWAMFYFWQDLSSVIYLKKSCGFACVAASIFAILPVEGHLGCSYLEKRLLLLNVVGSKPLRLAKAEQDMPCS